MQDLSNLPKRDWHKQLVSQEEFMGETLRIYSVKPQAHLIAVTQCVGLLEGYSMDAVLVKAFEKNYMMDSRPKVVEKYGFEQQHGEPIELVDFTYECIFDRAIEGEINRYRVGHSKNYESGRYVPYEKKGLTIIFPDDVNTPEERLVFLDYTVIPDFRNYVCALKAGAKRQAARRRLGEYRAVESVHKFNLRALWHIGRQRSSFSPNGVEVEPQINSVATQLVRQVEPYLPEFYDVLVKQIGKGYR